jgi:hypothetical protein
MKAIIDSDQPRDAGVEIHRVVRAANRPCQCVTGHCRSETENLCGRGGCYVDVDKLSPTDTRGDDEGDEDGNPSVVFVPSEGQERSEIAFPQGGDTTHQLRTLMPHKVICRAKQLRKRGHRGDQNHSQRG